MQKLRTFYWCVWLYDFHGYVNNILIILALQSFDDYIAALLPTIDLHELPHA